MIFYLQNLINIAADANGAKIVSDTIAHVAAKKVKFQLKNTLPWADVYVHESTFFIFNIQT